MKSSSAPGTYQYRVDLSNSGTAAAPIWIHAQDPANRPECDLSPKVSQWPGSNTLGDFSRGCSTVRGSHFRISGLVFTGCVESSTQASAGVRLVLAQDVVLRDIEVRNSHYGIDAVSDALDLEFVSLHNLQAYAVIAGGGGCRIQYSLIHDTGSNLIYMSGRDLVVATGSVVRHWRLQWPSA